MQIHQIGCGVEMHDVPGQKAEHVISSFALPKNRQQPSCALFPPFDWHHVCFSVCCSASFLSGIHFNCRALMLKDLGLSYDLGESSCNSSV